MTLKQREIFAELRLAMMAGQYSNLSKKEKLIYKNAFKNGYKLAHKHIKKNREYKVYSLFLITNCIKIRCFYFISKSSINLVV